jgi:hypothetical protein
MKMKSTKATLKFSILYQVKQIFSKKKKRLARQLFYTHETANNELNQIKKHQNPILILKSKFIKTITTSQPAQHDQIHKQKHREATDSAQEQ